MTTPLIKGTPMKVYYLAKIQQYTEAGMDYYATALQHDYPGVLFIGGDDLPVDPQTGVPTQKAALHLVGGIDHTQFVGNADLIQMPIADLSTKVAAMATSDLVKAKAGIVSLGYTTTEVNAVFSGADGFRDVLNHYGRLNDPAFDATNFDLTDL